MKLKRNVRYSLNLFHALAALLSASSAHAVSYYWDTNAAAGFGSVTGAWNGTNIFWNTDSTGAVSGTFIASPTSSDDLIVNGGTTGTITLSGVQSASSLTYAVNVAKTLSGGTSLTIGGTGTRSGIFVNTGDNANNSVTSPLILNAGTSMVNFSTAGTGSLTVGAISGSAVSSTQTVSAITQSSGGITFNNIISDGTAGGKVGVTVTSNSGISGGGFTLSGANTYTGPTNLVSGTTSISNVATFNNTSSIQLGLASRLTVSATNASLAKLAISGGGSGVVAGSFLRLSAAQTTAGAGNGPGTIFGTLEINFNNANPNYTIELGSGGAITNTITSTFTSPITLSGNASIDSSSAVATYTTGGITTSTAGSKTLSLSGTNTGNNTISSAIANGSGSMALTKGGSGTWILSGANTYTGNTRVDGGILQFNNQISLYDYGNVVPWSKSNIIVGDGATLSLAIGGAGQFTKADVLSLLTLSDDVSNGFSSGSSLGLDTSAGLFVFDSVIANTNGGSNVLGLNKLGTNTLVLDQDNTYTGRTLITSGTLQLGDGGITGKLSPSSIIVNNGNFTINRSNAVVQGIDFSGVPISGSGSFTQAGSGTTTLNAANTFSGTTIVNDGILRLTNALALQNSPLSTSGLGLVEFVGFTTPTLGGLTGAVPLSSVIQDYASAAASFTLNVVSGSVTYAGLIEDASSPLSVTKTGAGTQVLTANNLYTGTTTINRGTLTIGNGTAGSLNGSVGTNLTFTGTGTFNVAEAVSSNQGMGVLTLSAGDATISSTGIASQNSTLTFASLLARASGSTANFTLVTNTIAAQNQIVLSNTANAPLNNSGSSNQGIFFGTTEYARYDTTNNRFRAVIYGTDSNAAAIVATGTSLGIDDATRDVKVSGNITAQTSASMNTLNLAATTMTLPNSAQVLSVNGIIANNATLTTTGYVKTTPSFAGKIQPATAGGELVCNAAGNLTLNASIQDHTSASSFTKSGAGILTLGSSASTYSGGTTVNAGTVTFADNQGAATDTFFGSGPVVFNPGTTLSLNRTYVSNSLTLNNALVTAGNSFGSTLAGNITLLGASTFTVTGNLLVSGNISGTGGIIKAGTSFVLVSGNNSYTGPTAISGGAFVFGKLASLYNGDSNQWTKENITVNNTGALMLRVGGTGEFSITDATKIFSNLSTNVNANGLQAGSFFGLDASTSGGSFTISTNLTDSTGIGGGSVGLRFFGNNTMGSSVLELTGNNTYSGQTIVDRQAILKVSSINSVYTNPALGTVRMPSSSLGAPTSIAAGTIQLGTSASFQGAGLIYTGTGETTDRVISLGGSQGDNYRFEQSGTGHLKFLSNMVMTDTRGVKNITLQGSTAGTAEMAGVIPNAATSTTSTTVTKSGTGTWILSAANLYSGLTTVSGGTLLLSHVNALNGGNGATGGLGAITFSGGVIGLGANDFQRPLAAANTIGAATFSGAGGWSAHGADRAVNLGGASAAITWATANTGLNAQTLILGSNTATHTVDFQNPLNLGTATRTVRVDDGAADVDGILSGILFSGSNGSLSKTGAGTLVLSAANTYSGTTAVSAGRLLINGNQSGATGAVSVTGSGILGGTGTIGGAVSVTSASAKIAPGMTTGTLTTLGNVNIGGDLEIDINDSLTIKNDTLAVGGNLDVGSAILNLNVTGTPTQSAYVIATYTTLTTDAPFLEISGMPDGYEIDYVYNDGKAIAIKQSVTQTAYDVWFAAKGLTTTNNAKNLDPDGDGKNNLYEFAFDGDPLSAANDGKIVGKVASVNGSQVLTLTLPVRTGAVFSANSGDQLSALVDGIYYRIEGDETLNVFADTIAEVNGTDAAVIQSGLPALSTGWTYRTFRAPGTTATNAKAFLRAKVSETP